MYACAFPPEGALKGANVRGKGVRLSLVFGCFALATSWKIAKDGKTYVFNLRHNVKFQDGTRFNAKAVCTNFNRWYNFSGPFQDASATYYYQAIFGGFRHNESNTLSPPLYRSCS